MKETSNIFLIAFLVLFGSGSITKNLLAQENKAEITAEHLLSKIKKSLKSDNPDSVYISAMKLFEYSKEESLDYYEGKSTWQLGRYFRGKGDADSTIYYFDISGKAFEKCNDTLNTGKANTLMAIALKNKGDIKGAEVHFLKAIDLLGSISDTAWYGYANDHLGLMLFKQGNYTKALKHTQMAQDAYKKVKHNINIGTTYNTMGVIYTDLNEVPKAEDAYLNAIEYLRKEDTYVVLGQAYNNLAEIYIGRGEVDKAFKTLDKAKEVFVEVDNDLGFFSYNIVKASYYASLNPPINNKVIEHSLISADIASKLGDFRIYAHAANFLGRAYFNLGLMAKARSILEKGLMGAEENGYKSEIVMVSKTLSEVYYKLNLPKKAYRLLKKQAAIKDSIVGEDKIKEFTQLDLQYKFRQQHLSDSLKNVQRELEKDFEHKKELRDQQKTKAIFISISILVIIIAIFIFANSRKKKKQVKVLNEKNRKIHDQKNEIEESAKKVDSAYVKLKELDEYKHAMTNMLVHDLKNPLNLLVNLDSIEDGNEKNIIINRTSNQMLNLVMNLLDINKAENNMMKLEKTETGLFNVFGSAIGETMFLSKQRNIKIINESSTDFNILADREILTRVIVNLLTNAIKFSPSDSKVVLTTKITQRGQLRVSVKDNGKGIPKEYHKTIFEKFKQVEQIKSGGIKSTGLGLAFCKLAVESHGWEIGVDSGPGKGAEFWIILDRFHETGKLIDNQDETINTQDELQFSEQEKIILRPYLAKLSKFNIYSLSEIENLLTALKKENIDGIGIWIQEVVIATENLNEENFKKLLEQLANQINFA
ncbi:MAG: hypothetical protein DRJ05_06855 [Bacteroidetes bacterium]|nr:MAG: hypothetical protein DRJ05_06855 [Bacteroidota bacterium]